MKATRRQLKEIIRRELTSVIQEINYTADLDIVAIGGAGGGGGFGYAQYVADRQRSMTGIPKGGAGGQKLTAGDKKIFSTIATLLDPTGISNWGDLGDSIDKYADDPGFQTATVLAINAVGVVPLIGKGGIALKGMNYAHELKKTGKASKGIVTHANSVRKSSRSVEAALGGGKQGKEAVDYLMTRAPSLDKREAEIIMKGAKWADDKGVVTKMHVAGYYASNFKEAALVKAIEKEYMPTTVSGVKELVDEKDKAIAKKKLDKKAYAENMESMGMHPCQDGGWHSKSSCPGKGGPKVRDDWGGDDTGPSGEAGDSSGRFAMGMTAN
jgi:hypothetical protein